MIQCLFAESGAVIRCVTSSNRVASILKRCVNRNTTLLFVELSDFMSSFTSKKSPQQKHALLANALLLMTKPPVHAGAEHRTSSATDVTLSLMLALICDLPFERSNDGEPFSPDSPLS